MKDIICIIYINIKKYKNLALSKSLILFSFYLLGQRDYYISI